MNKTLKGLLWAGAGLAGIAAANNAVFARAKALSNTLGGEGRFWPGPYGDLFYTRQGKGQPVILLHGIYAGASSYEWRKNFDSLSEHFNVYAVDWLGFGLSDKPRIRYTAPMMVAQLTQFLQEVVRESADIVASSIGVGLRRPVGPRRPGGGAQPDSGLPDRVPASWAKSRTPRRKRPIRLLRAPLHRHHASITASRPIASLRWYLMQRDLLRSVPTWTTP